MIDETDDAQLVALIDNQLDETTRQAVHTRLMVEPDLRARYQQLAAGGLPFRAAFEAALADAPVSRMRAKLAPLDSDARRAQPRRRIAAVAAAVAVALFAVGWTIGRFAPGSTASDEREDWRMAVAGYASLYTKETFAGLDSPPDPAALARLSQALGVAVTPASIALPDLNFKWAGMLAYDDAPLGEIAYLDGGGDPVVFCIIRNGGKDAPLQADAREGVAIASWARGGRGFLVGGRISKQRATELAATLAARF
jgi:anti-sigma factor RsiW